MRQISGIYVLAALSAILVGHCASRLHAADQRSTLEQTGYGLQIGTETDYVRSLDGGSVVAQVVEEKAGTDIWPRKHLAAPMVEDVRAHIRPDQFTKFLSESLTGSNRSDGAMYLLSGVGQVAQQRSLTHMMLNELTIPALSGSSKDALYLQIGLAVERSSLVKGGTAFSGAKAAPHAKAAMGNSFVLTIPGLPTNRVQSIEPITMRRKTTTDAVGEMREYTKQPGIWEVSNIVFYIAAADAQQFLDWHDDFVVKGNNGNDKEKTLTLELKASDMSSTLLTFNASGVGIVAAKYNTPAAATETVTRLRVEVYAERMTLDPGKTSTAAQPTNNNDTKTDSRGTMRRGVETPPHIRGR